MSYYKINKSRVVYTDIDDTLILWEPSKYLHSEQDLISFSDEYGEWKLLPHKRNIEFLINLKRQGYGIVAWSAAGNDWAAKIIDKLGLQNVVDVVLSKPELCIDDLLEANRIIKSVVWIDPATGDYKRNS